MKSGNLNFLEPSGPLRAFTGTALPVPIYILGAFAKLRKATISSVLSYRLPVRMQQLGSHWTNFHGILYLSVFRKYVKKIQVSLKLDKNTGYFLCGPTHILIISRSFLLRIKNVSDKSCRETLNTYFIFCNFFFRKWCRL